MTDYLRRNYSKELTDGQNHGRRIRTEGKGNIIAMRNKKLGCIWPKPSTPSRWIDYSIILIHSIICVKLCAHSFCVPQQPYLCRSAFHYMRQLDVVKLKKLEYCQRLSRTLFSKAFVQLRRPYVLRRRSRKRIRRHSTVIWHETRQAAHINRQRRECRGLVRDQWRRQVDCWRHRTLVCRMLLVEEGRQDHVVTRAGEVHWHIAAGHWVLGWLLERELLDKSSINPQ